MKRISKTTQAGEPAHSTGSASNEKKSKKCYLQVPTKDSTKVAKVEDMSDNIISTNDSPLAKKLKEDIFLLRKKSKEDGIKIKCLQNKIRRILRKQGMSKEDNSHTQRNLDLKRRRSSNSGDESSDSTEIMRNDLETEVKYELIDENKRSGLTASTDATTELEEELIESVKLEQEDDPLT